jgi:2-polyprenyl-3-methyl-5-hydroxy-6-metoxy-1,4-benzoquinol methylase
MKNPTKYITVKDHSISGEEFQLLYNEELDMLETRPQPGLNQLSGYYKSDDYISHTDLKRNLFEKAYHWVRNISLRQKLKLINSFNSEERKLLDVGCGTGDFLKLAQEHNWKVSGIELSEKARAIANKKTNDSVFDVEHLEELDPKSYDIITLWHVLEHLPELNEQISIFKSLLKCNGVLIIAVPNYKSYDSKYYMEFWAAFDVPRHLWHFSQKAISRLVKIEKMNVVKTLPLKWDSYYVSLLSEKYKSGKMNFFNAFRTGWVSNFRAKRTGEYSSLIYIIKND